jgi:hypothetical protein
MESKQMAHAEKNFEGLYLRPAPQLTAHAFTLVISLDGAGQVLKWTMLRTGSASAEAERRVREQITSANMQEHKP